MSWRYNYYTPSKPIKVKDGIKAKSRRGDIGDTWWSKRWVSVLETFGWGNRLQRGKRYARSGQVREYEVNKGIIRAKVQGSVRTPYNVSIEVKEYQEKQWKKIIDKLSQKAIFTAKLLAGTIPPEIEELFQKLNVSLFPASKKELTTKCSCPDSANPCKHIAAVHYILAEELDLDPFLIFMLRGKTQEEISDALREIRRDHISEQLTESSADTIPVRSFAEKKPTFSQISPPLSIDDFWGNNPSKVFSLTINPPNFSYATLKKLGSPPFWDVKEDFLESLKPYYRKTVMNAYNLLTGEFGDNEIANDEDPTFIEQTSPEIDNDEDEINLQARFEAETGKNAIWGGRITKGYLEWKQNQKNKK